ncbi:hypothetical protein HF325_006647 [Metschnikowia pulcherrima]|uniref:Kinase n=1 Tax=Metschnikowia pulcherrima TaxID=27326 RepID=A0A8H7L9A7_9ASCO|nr:hypothetical protein HF325_006647 [Metschnikowia pulcherrima]
MNFIPSAHQAAGHDGCLTAGPVFAKLTLTQEIAFYAEATRRLSVAPDLLGSLLAHWMPTYMGTMKEGVGLVDGAFVLNPDNVSLDGTNTKKLYLVLLNLYHGFSHPCILDIKLGSVLTDDTVTPEKKARLAAVSQATTSGSLAFRICGMKIFHMTPLDGPLLFPNMQETMLAEPAGKSGTYTSFDKFFGRSLTEENVGKALELFFQSLHQKKLLLTRFHQRLQLLYNCLLDTEVRIKSGSLLFIYEGDPARWTNIDETNYFETDPLVCDPLDASDGESDSDSDADTGEAPLSRLNLIDFAHAKFADGQGPDDNIIDGVENLIRIFGLLAA